MFVFLLLMVLPFLLLVEALLALHRLMFPLLLIFLDLLCISFLVVRLLTLVVGSLSTLIHVLFRIIARALCLVLVPDAMMVYGSLTGFVFLPLPPPPVSRPRLPQPPALFSSGIIVLAIYVVLVSRL